MLFGKKIQKNIYDKDKEQPILRCRLCTGDPVAGVKDISTGRFEEIMLIRNEQDLADFMKMYGITTISKEY